MEKSFLSRKSRGSSFFKNHGWFLFMAFNANGSDGNRNAVLITLLRRRSTVLKPNLSRFRFKSLGSLKNCSWFQHSFIPAECFISPSFFTPNNVPFATTPWYHDRETSLRNLAGPPDLANPWFLRISYPIYSHEYVFVIYPFISLLHGEMVNQ